MGFLGVSFGGNIRLLRNFPLIGRKSLTLDFFMRSLTGEGLEIGGLFPPLSVFGNSSDFCFFPFSGVGAMPKKRKRSYEVILPVGVLGACAKPVAAVWI